MKTNKYKLYFFPLIVLMGILSCEPDDDFLREVPNTFYTLENAFSTAAQVDAAVIACYQFTRNRYMPNNHTYITLRGKGTDILDVPSHRFGQTLQDYSAIDPQRGEFNWVYSSMYQLISRANTAIFAADLEHITWVSEEEKNYVVAQAKFFRAFAYRNLGQLFGGVPIVDELISEPRFDFVRSTRVETYQFAIDDLESTLDHLPETTSQGGRIVKGAAQHLLSELYLSMGIELEEQGQSGIEMFNKAITFANELIDGGIYSLMTERFGTRMNETPSDNLFWDPGTADVYWDLFQEGNVLYQDGNHETIWAFPIDMQARFAEDGQSRLPYPRSFGPVFRWIDGFIGTLEDGGGRGVAFVSPSPYTRELVWEGIVGENDMRNAEHNIRRTFYYNDPSFEGYGEVIPYDVIYANEAFYGMIFPVHMKINTDKYSGLDQGDNHSNLYRDEPVFRLAETVLLRAEAYYRTDNLVNAANDINLIRDRAQATYRVSPSDVTIDFILDERARELYAEEHRWNTLLRMGGTVAVDRIREYAFRPDITDATLTWDFNLWPIPQAVIDRNIGANLEQNPGWTQF